MTDEREHDQDTARARRRVRWTVALVGGVAALIYLGFIGRGVIG